jgi:hypothetical protein
MLDIYVYVHALIHPFRSGYEEKKEFSFGGEPHSF